MFPETKFLLALQVTNRYSPEDHGADKARVMKR